MNFFFPVLKLIQLSTVYDVIKITKTIMIHEILSSILRVSYSDVISCLGINLFLFLT